MALGACATPSGIENPPASPTATSAAPTSETLSAQQQAIVPIAAYAAAGDITKLSVALDQGLDAGLTVSDAREVLLQVYAYAGFPRSLNALNELMRVLKARKQRGMQDAPGRAPSRPTGSAVRSPAASVDSPP